MNTQPSILAATADSLWPNTVACCRAVRPSDLLLVLCATRLLVVVGDGLMMNQFSILASTTDSVGPSIARRHATASGCTPLRTQRGCPGSCIAAPLLVLFIASLLVVAKDGLMITQPSILAATADNLWPNTAACRAVRPGSSGVVRHYRCATASSRAAAPQSRASQLQVSRCATNTRHRHQGPPHRPDAACFQRRISGRAKELQGGTPLSCTAAAATARLPHRQHARVCAREDNLMGHRSVVDQNTLGR